ncbi:hypothetical protein F5D26_01010 [Burkholderia pseudomallei]|nr:hypothetical protein CXQ84_08440 [Burkholderia pseudomallei]KAA8771188.1 hypothetical protein F5D26_01010 [Burkholderia pseudomallei]
MQTEPRLSFPGRRRGTRAARRATRCHAIIERRRRAPPGRHGPAHAGIARREPPRPSSPAPGGASRAAALRRFA